MTTPSIRVRFAPSPTGPFHIGGVRTLLFNWFFAKKNHGTLILRIEDTDRARSTLENEKNLLADIKRFGIDYQEGPDVGGPHAPYRQSERFKMYADYAKKLVSEDRAYYCFCSPETLAQKSEAALKLGRTPIYDGTCSRQSLDAAKARMAKGEKAGLRFRSPKKNYTLTDMVRGDIEFKDGTVGDFLITRSPNDGEQEIGEGIGMPVYNFCCVIDDHGMALTHVIRGEDHLSNSVRQLMMYEAFGWKPPQFAHMAMVLGSDRQKLSKRNGDASVKDYLDKGYLPEAIINFLALLGWWPGADVKSTSGHPEIFSVQELIQHFDVKGLQKSAAVFDVQKLQWMNSHYIRALPLEEVAQRSRPFFESSEFQEVKDGVRGKSEAWFNLMIDSIRGEVMMLSELPKLARFFFNSELSLEDEAKKILSEPQAPAVVQAFEKGLSGQTGDLNAEQIDTLQKQVAKDLGVKGKALFMPFRAITTGSAHGPELKKVLPLLGRQEVLKRIQSLKQQASIS